MGLNLKACLNILGGMLKVLSLTFILPFLTAVIYEEEINQIVFGATALLCYLIGFCLATLTTRPTGDLRIREGFFVVSMTWIIFPIIAAMPFSASGEIPHYYDAVFETCSALSTTGATILEQIEALSPSMLMWRSLMHWIGGMGVLFLVIALIPLLYKGKQNIALESTGPTIGKTKSKLSDTAKSLYMIYIGLSTFQLILLKIGGMSLYDALIHTFGSVGTGGFSNYGDSIAHFDSLYIEIVIIVFMYLASISFNLYFAALIKGPMEILKDAEFKAFTAIIILATIAITISLFLRGGYEIGPAIRSSLFQVVSIITTTGFMTDDYDLWPRFARSALFFLFFIGGCTSSTAGGIKVFRIIVLFKLLRRSVQTRLHPNAVANIRLNGAKVPADVTINVTSFLFLYLAVLLGGTLLVSLDDYDFITNFSATASCLGNIGPGLNLVGPTLSYNLFSPFVKCVLSFLMVAGRLEIYTFLAFFSLKFWNPDRY